MLRSLSAAAALAAVLLTASAADASAQVTAGTPNVGPGNCLPFGCAVGHARVEQIYSASLFSAPFAITSITLYNSRGTGTLAKGEFSLYLSTTSASPTAPAVTSPSALTATNVTGPETLFATLSSPGGTAVGSTLMFSGAAFLYTPSMGNLLLDIRYTPNGFNTNPVYLDAFTGATVGRTTDYSAFLGTDNRASYGLVTTFGGTVAVTATPEPATVALFGAGLVGLAAVARRRVRPPTPRS